jgi:hypothetical protein
LADGEVDNNLPAAIRQLTPNDLLLRVLAKQKWLTDLHEAFMLRSNEMGLSVFFDCTPVESVVLSGFNRSYGVSTLTVASITALELTVTPDEPRHATIEGLPHKEHDADRAEWLASRLAEVAEIVDTTKREQ